MPKIEDDLEAFIGKTGATVCRPLPPATRMRQRGPSCGFYALGHVMQYWHGKLANTPDRVPKPLPARTHMDEPKAAPRTELDRAIRDFGAWAGEFTSLRQYGKYHRFTAYGSVFNAENLIKVARLQGVDGHSGTYDGHIIAMTDPADYVEKVKKLIDKECPVIVPFDVQAGTGDPCLRSGKAAHWAAIFGYYSEASKVYFIHYHWGFYRFSPALDFASSTQNLTSNAFLILQKVEVARKDTGQVVLREHLSVRSLQRFSNPNLAVKPLGEPVANVEFNNPEALDLPFALDEYNELLKKHGFDPTNVTNARLRGKLVAIYPTKMRGSLEMIGR